MKRTYLGVSGVLATILILTLFMSTEVFALNGSVEGKEVSAAKYMADTVWVLLAAFLVFFMQAGFAMVESGFTRAKNAVNILMKNLMDFSIGSVAFWAVGFAIMFGNGNSLLGLSGWFVPAESKAFASLEWSSVPTYAAWLFQLVFAATAATIVSGAMAERTRFKSYLIYTIFITGFIYPVVGHWIWGGGWLSGLGMVDFAGSTVVHSTGGWLALAGAIVLGARVGKYDANGNPRPIPGHNLPLAALGVFILWLGWFGFNPGSQMGADAIDISLNCGDDKYRCGRGWYRGDGYGMVNARQTGCGNGAQWGARRTGSNYRTLCIRYSRISADYRLDRRGRGRVLGIAL